MSENNDKLKLNSQTLRCKLGTGVYRGASDHSELTGRDADAQHPINAIDGLQKVLDDKANSDAIPKKVSELENDSGYLTEHQDISSKEDVANKVQEMTPEQDQEKCYPSLAAMTKYVGEQIEGIPTEPSDWNVNRPDQPGYVQNRTHYDSSVSVQATTQNFITSDQAAKLVKLGVPMPSGAYANVNRIGDLPDDLTMPLSGVYSGPTWTWPFSYGVPVTFGEKVLTDNDNIYYYPLPNKNYCKAVFIITTDCTIDDVSFKSGVYGGGYIGNVATEAVVGVVFEGEVTELPYKYYPVAGSIKLGHVFKPQYITTAKDADQPGASYQAQILNVEHLPVTGQYVTVKIGDKTYDGYVKDDPFFWGDFYVGNYRLVDNTLPVYNDDNTSLPFCFTMWYEYHNNDYGLYKEPHMKLYTQNRGSYNISMYITDEALNPFAIKDMYSSYEGLWIVYGSYWDWSNYVSNDPTYTIEKAVVTYTSSAAGEVTAVAENVMPTLVSASGYKYTFGEVTVVYDTSAETVTVTPDTVDPETDIIFVKSFENISKIPQKYMPYDVPSKDNVGKFLKTVEINEPDNEGYGLDYAYPSCIVNVVKNSSGVYRFTNSSVTGLQLQSICEKMYTAICYDYNLYHCVSNLTPVVRFVCTKTNSNGQLIYAEFKVNTSTDAITYTDWTVIGSSGSSGASSFVVTVTYNEDSDTFTSDKTFAEIEDAVNSGALVRCHYLNKYYIDLWSITNGAEARFLIDNVYITETDGYTYTHYLMCLKLLSDGTITLKKAQFTTLNESGLEETYAKKTEISDLESASNKVEEITPLINQESSYPSVKGMTNYVTEQLNGYAELGRFLPQVNTTDNGKILKVVNGVWTVSDI